jgi:hypothetical protein
MSLSETINGLRYSMMKISELEDIIHAELKKYNKIVKEQKEEIIGTQLKIMHLYLDTGDDHEKLEELAKDIDNVAETRELTLYGSWLDYNEIEKRRELKDILRSFLFYKLIEGGEKPRKKILKRLEVLNDKIDDMHEIQDYSQIKYKMKKTKMFAYHLVKFYCFDSGCNIDLFADSLLLTGEFMRDRGNCVGSEKRGRKCMHMGAALKQAYGSGIFHPIYSKNLERSLTLPRMGINVPNNKYRRQLMYEEMKLEQQYQTDAWNNITKLWGQTEHKSPAINFMWD